MGKRILIMASIVFGVWAQTIGAQTPIVTIKLEKDEIGIVKTAPGITTRLSFLEPPVEIICGDLYDPNSGTGSFVVQRSGNDVFLKPIASKGVSNMFVKTGEGVEKIYNFDLVIVPAAQAFRIVNVTGGQPAPGAAIKKARARAADLPVIASIIPISFGPAAAPDGKLLNRRPEEMPTPPSPLIIPRMNVDLVSPFRRDVVKRVPAEYPEIARKTGVYGQVVVEVMIDEKGKVAAAQAVSGPLLLRGAAVVAAKFWRFTEAKMRSDVTHEIGRITFNFRSPEERTDSFFTLSGASGAGRGRRN